VTDLLDRVAEQWYSVPQPDVPIAQGDQLWGVVIRMVADSPTGLPVVIPTTSDLVILAQSCDLKYEKIDSVLCAPVHPLGEWIEWNPGDLSRLEDVRQGYDPSLYLLPSWPSAPYSAARSDRVIDFTNLRTVDLGTLDQARTTGIPRLALRSPAREHLAQAIARAFMRVGLPIDIPSFALERAGRHDEVFSVTPDVAEILGAARLTLTQPIPVAVSQRKRSSTGETYFLVTTRLPEHRPQILGAGMDLLQARRSFARRLIAAEDDNDVRWLRDYLAPLG
jgi:hypothetical protein